MINLPENFKGFKNYELVISEDCNLRCKYCFDDTLSDRKNEDCLPTIMPLDMIPRIQDFILKTRDKEFEGMHISFFGGEPLMNWDFIEKFVNTSKNIFDFRYSFSFGTNGTLLDDKKIDFILNNNINFTVSVDGKQKSHDKYRVYSDNKPSWNKSIIRLPEIAAKKINSFSINLTLNPDTLDDLESNYLFIQELCDGRSQILINFDAIWSPEDLIKLESIWNKMFLYNDIPLPKSYIDRIVGKTNSHCITPDYSISINVIGQLFFCHRLIPKMTDVKKCNYQDYYGDITQGLTTDYYDKIKLRTTFDEWSIGKECENCTVKYSCYGGCIAAHQWKTKDIDKIYKPLCDITHIIFNENLINKIKQKYINNCCKP